MQHRHRFWVEAVHPLRLITRSLHLRESRIGRAKRSEWKPPPVATSTRICQLPHLISYPPWTVSTDFGSIFSMERSFKVALSTVKFQHMFSTDGSTIQYQT